MVLLGRHLAATKLEAAEKENNLKQEIKLLQQDNEKLLRYIEGQREKVEHLQSENYQLKLENSKKWRVQERDDWRSLVTAVQEDRCVVQCSL